MDELNVYIDESGNLGTSDNYFVIACVISENEKPVRNFMKKAELKVKRTFTKFGNAKEIKASDAYPPIKEYYYRKISEKDFQVFYIVADKNCIYSYLNKDKNNLYSYLLHFLIVQIVKAKKCNKINLIMDNHTVRTESKNSFADYINIKLNFELGIDCNVSVKYVDSCTSYMVQVADFIANALFAFHEYNDNTWCHFFENKISYVEKFPRRCF